MQKTIPVRSLKLGMHVVLPLSWLKHPFLKNHFTISTRTEIDRIIEFGFKDVVIDLDKGIGDEASTVPETSPPATWAPEALMTTELREAINDRKLEPEKKARVVYTSSLQIMEKLLENPTAENITEVKKGIAEIVDLIISDTETSNSLLMITSHDFYTYTHSVNVGVYSIMIAKAYFSNLDAHDMHELGAGFFLHDIGKVRISPAIINKNGKLDAEEMAVMKTHPVHGYDILSETEHLTEECRVIVMQHHERSNGSGYPKSLRGEEIHSYGRICSMADVYDALVSDRSYQQKRTTYEALKLMKETLIDHFTLDLFGKLVMLFER